MRMQVYCGANHVYYGGGGLGVGSCQVEKPAGHGGVTREERYMLR